MKAFPPEIGHDTNRALLDTVSEALWRTERGPPVHGGVSLPKRTTPGLGATPPGAGAARAMD
jgi:hypothetical protein